MYFLPMSHPMGRHKHLLNINSIDSTSKKDLAKVEGCVYKYYDYLCDVKILHGEAGKGLQVGLARSRRPGNSMKRKKRKKRI
jgi:hypothetical protein